MQRFSALACRVAERLGRFEDLRSAAAQYWTAERQGGTFADLEQGFVSAAMSAFADIAGPDLGKGLVVRVLSRRGAYAFRFDRFGEHYETLPGGPNLDQWEDERRAISGAEELLAATDALGLPVAALVDVGVLPSSVSEGETRAALARVKALMSRRGAPGEASSDLPVLRSFVAACTHAGRLLSWVAAWALRISGEAGGAGGGAALRAIARYVDLAQVAQGLEEHDAAPGSLALSNWLSEPPPDPPAVPKDLFPSAPDVRVWRRALEPERDRPPGEPPDPAPLWDGWRDPVLRALSDPAAPPAPTPYGNLVLAAAGRWPGALFRRPLSEMGVQEWSDLAIRAFPRSPPALDRPPFWAFLAALRALGFDRAILDDATRLGTPADPEEARAINSLVAGARPPDPARPGVLWVDVTSDTLTRAPARPADTAILAIRPEMMEPATPLLVWLRDRGAFGRLVAERDVDDANADPDIP